MLEPGAPPSITHEGPLLLKRRRQFDPDTRYTQASGKGAKSQRFKKIKGGFVQEPPTHSPQHICACFHVGGQGLPLGGCQGTGWALVVAARAWPGAGDPKVKT
jgi:hypothetical protein